MWSWAGHDGLASDGPPPSTWDMADAVSRSAAESGAPAPAQELYILWGGQHTEDLDDNTYSYGFEYLHNLSEHWVARFCWLNEGHVTNHHRDGHTVPAWASATASELERDFVVELFAVRVTPPPPDSSAGQRGGRGLGARA